MQARSKSYLITGTPIPWQRPRLNNRRFFDGQAREKLAYGITLIQQHNDEPLFSKPLRMDITFYMAIPQSLKARKKSEFHCCKPDLDNLCKWVLDSIKNVLITDDKIISLLTAKKVYDKEPRTSFVITEV